MNRTGTCSARWGSALAAAAALGALLAIAAALPALAPAARLRARGAVNPRAGLATKAPRAAGPQLIRTARVAPVGVDPNGPSQEPSLDASGQIVAFSSKASNLGPNVGLRPSFNIYRFDFRTNQATLISASAVHPGTAGNGNSTNPSMSADGSVVAFASTATNLVSIAHRRIDDIFVRIGGAPVRMVSVAFGGVQPDAPSTQPVVSGNGRFVAFTSSADNLVPGDDNAVSDVFLADLQMGTIRRVSLTSTGGQANAASYNPSIDADGQLVSFTSAATNLVPGRAKGAAKVQVYVRDLATGKTFRVSVSSHNKPQNASVPAGFTQYSSLSATGGAISFDSNATNLAPGPSGAHTEVFRRSLATGRTTLVSASPAGKPADNDSFYPAISADGNITVFDSFADNLAPAWAPVENVFAGDARTGGVMTADVSPSGGPRGPELDAQLLQHPAIAGNDQVMAFVSGADNLVGGDYNGADDVFVRAISPPSTDVVSAPPTTSSPRPTFEFRGTLPLSSFALCVLDSHHFACPLGRPFQLPHVGGGRHTLHVEAGAPGTLYDPLGAIVTFTRS